MGPKIESAIQFVKATKRQVLITDVDVLREALQGKDGTVVVAT
jgi:carbamate kinase